ncbi:MAG: hypothetical protein HN757_09485 [Calditrichaeota bacterium]|jgi:hypothetical protein|nr:hypothetical protein [Calditrichota bacterium]
MLEWNEEIVEKIVKDSGTHSLGETCGRYVWAKAYDLKDEINMLMKPFKRGVFGNMPFKVNKRLLVNETLYLLVIAGHLAVSTRVPEENLSANLGDYFESVAKYFPIKQLINKNDRKDFFDRMGAFSSAIGKVDRNSINEDELTQTLLNVFYDYYPIQRHPLEYVMLKAIIYKYYWEPFEIIWHATDRVYS